MPLYLITIYIRQTVPNIIKESNRESCRPRLKSGGVEREEKKRREGCCNIYCSTNNSNSSKLSATDMMRICGGVLFLSFFHFYY